MTGAALILCYHALSPDWPATLSIAPRAFERQVRMLRAAGFTGTTFTEAVRSPGRRTVAITFDDAYRSVLDLAVPILDRVGWPATVFAPTDPVSAGVPMSWPGIDRWHGGPHARELTPLSWDELRGLRDRGWEIGSHTCTHPRLTELGDGPLLEELTRSREAVSAEMGAPCRSLAYPYGDVDARVAERAGAAGYEAAASLSARVRGAGPLVVPRIGVWHGEPLWRVVLKASPPVRRLRGSELLPRGA